VGNSWYANQYPGADTPVQQEIVGGPQPFFRNYLDAQRSSWRTPEAQYPDGYLGTVPSRRQDRLLDGLRQRTQKPYHRGVHKGTKIDPADYLWPPEFHPLAGLEAEARGLKFVSVAMVQDVEGQGILVNDGKPGPDPNDVSRLANLAPPWSGRGQMGLTDYGRPV
jgi:hypothetical protein